MQRLILPACLLLAAAVAAAADVPTVHCPREAPVVRTLVAEEIWRLDPEDPDLPLLGVITDVEADPGGSLFLVDMQLDHILVLSPDGAYEQTLGREGDGPGELRRADDLTLLADGTLAVRMAYPLKIVLLDRDGTPAGSWSSRAAGYTHRCRPLGEGWVLVSHARDHERSTGARAYETLSLALFDEDGELGQTFLSSEKVTSFDPPVYHEADSYFPSNTWDVTAAEQVVVAPDRDAYRLEYHDPDGTLTRVVTRDFTPHRRNAEEKEEQASHVGYSVNGQRLDVTCHMLDTDPAIAGLRARSDGTLWVEHCHLARREESHEIAAYDVHGPDGALECELRIVVAGEVSAEDRWFVLDDGRAVCVHNFTGAARNYWAAAGAALDEDEAAEDLDDAMLTVSCWRLTEQTGDGGGG